MKRNFRSIDEKVIFTSAVAAFSWAAAGASKNVVRIIGLLVSLLSLAATQQSPVASPQIATNGSLKAIEAAKEQGAISARADIKAGNFRILYFGRPWSNGKPLVDEATDYPVQIVAGCAVTKAFVAEVEAYNSVMREWHAQTVKGRSSDE